MSIVRTLDPKEEAANIEVIEDLRQRLLGNFNVTVDGNRLTLRWWLHGHPVDAHAVILSVTTPHDASEIYPE
jgi:hypothetical protein